MAEEKMLEGKVALITGAGRGLGREEALLFAKHGCNLVINDLGAGFDGEGAETKVADEVASGLRSPRVPLKRHCLQSIARRQCLLSRNVLPTPPDSPPTSARTTSRRGPFGAGFRGGPLL